MNKAELVEAIAKKTNASKKESDAFVKAFLETVTETLVKEEEIQLIGFGSFSVSKRAGRMGKNPQTGEEMEIAAYKVAKWKPAKPLKEAVNR